MLLLTVVVWAAVNQPSPSPSAGQTFIGVLGALGGLTSVATLIGAVIAWRRYKVDQATSSTNNLVSLKEIALEELRTSFPGGAGEIVAFWKSEYDEVVEQLRTARERIVLLEHQDAAKTIKIQQLEGDLDAVGHELRDARSRITYLERTADG